MSPEPAPAGFCGACGRPLAEAVHGDCARRLHLDPPRYCTTCGFRLDVQVFPDGVRSSCRECRRRARATPPTRRGSARPGVTAE